MVYHSCDGVVFVVFFFQAEDGIRDAQESRGLGDVYKRQRHARGPGEKRPGPGVPNMHRQRHRTDGRGALFPRCLLYTSDAADDLLCVDLGGRRIIKKKTN